MIAAGVIGGLYVLCAIILSVGVREKRGEAWGMPWECLLAEPLASRSRSLPWRRGAAGASAGYLGPGEGAAGGQCQQGMLQRSPEDLALCTATDKPYLCSWGWLRLLVSVRASQGEVMSKVQCLLSFLPSAFSSAYPMQVTQTILTSP